MMKMLIRFLLAAVLAAWTVPALAASPTLLKVIITGAVSNVTTALVQFLDGPPLNLEIQSNFVYGSAGTTADFYVQTSFDGTTWCDIANFHQITASAREVVNLSSLTAVTTLYACTDATLTNDTVKDGVIGPWVRVKYSSTGTYSGGTSIQIDVSSRSRVQ